MSRCFPEPYESSSENVKVELDLSSYVTKSDLKEANIYAGIKNIFSLLASKIN